MNNYVHVIQYFRMKIIHSKSIESYGYFNAVDDVLTTLGNVSKQPQQVDVYLVNIIIVMNNRKP